ncbi:hypothetical protein ACO1DI_12740, partial [Priestia sp. 40]|uniref:hypothetical protein n=1 Tax=Priestia sp. 40 TaxID=3394459 RepID=UPI003BF76578
FFILLGSVIRNWVFNPTYEAEGLRFRIYRETLSRFRAPLQADDLTLLERYKSSLAYDHLLSINSLLKND